MAVEATIQSTKGPARWEWYITKIVAQLRVLARADQAHPPLCFSLSFCPPSLRWITQFTPSTTNNLTRQMANRPTEAGTGALPRFRQQSPSNDGGEKLYEPWDEPSRVCGLRKKTFWLVIGVVVFAAIIGVSIGLGVGLTSRVGTCLRCTQEKAERSTNMAHLQMHPRAPAVPRRPRARRRAR